MVKPLIGISLFSLIFIGGAYFVLTSGSKPEVPIISYSASAADKPVAKTERDFEDLGKMKVSDIKEKEFTITNAGAKPLQLTNVSSSCGCTTGQIIYKGIVSQEFSMHTPSDYVTSVAPQTSATVKVKYQPSLMPVYGNVEREVYIGTNDPIHPKLVFKVKAYVE